MALDPVTAALEVGSKLIDRFFPDPATRDQAKLDLLKMQQTGELAILASETSLAQGQLEINKQEAASASVFVSGWRPGIGWVCGAAFAYAAILEPLGRFVAVVWFGYSGAFPAVDTALTMQTLFGLLGLGGLRTYEKVRGVAAK